MKVIKDKGEDKIEVEGDLEEIEETFYEQTVFSEDLEDIKVNPKIETFTRISRKNLNRSRKKKVPKILTRKVEIKSKQRNYQERIQMERHDI